MTKAAPRVLRKGALVRVSGGPQDTGADVVAYLDLRFPDGHVERWLGPGQGGNVPEGPETMAALQVLGAEASDEFAFDIAVDVKRDFGLPKPPDVHHLRCEEVVFEWNHPTRFQLMPLGASRAKHRQGRKLRSGLIEPPAGPAQRPTGLWDFPFAWLRERRPAVGSTRMR